MSEAAHIWCPFADEESAAAAASVLLGEGLVACVNIVPAMRSIYVWNGEKGDVRECGALFKTRADLLDQAVARLSSVHPYDTPAITAWLANRASQATLEWLAGMGQPGGSR